MLILLAVITSSSENLDLDLMVTMNDVLSWLI